MYYENVSFGSQVIPRVFGCFVVANVRLFKLNDRVVPYSAGYGVKRLILCKNIVKSLNAD